MILISRQISTGKIIEMMGGGYTDDAALRASREAAILANAERVYPDDVEVSWVTESEYQTILNTKTLEEERTAKIEALASYRFEKETGGLTLGGVSVLTDRVSQAMLNGAKTLTDLDETTLIDWKGVNGWAQIDKTTVLALCQAVGVHVQACFTNEKAHSVAISALGTIDAIKAYDITTGWPE